MKSRIEIIPIPVVPDIKAGDRLDIIILESMKNANEFLLEGDIVVVAQKVISKAEGRLIDLKLVNPSEKSLQIAKQNDKDPRLIELILNESVDILRLAQRDPDCRNKARANLCKRRGRPKQRGKK